MDLGKIVQSLAALVQGIQKNQDQIPESDIQSAEQSLDSVYEKLRRIRGAAEKIRDSKRGTRSLQREPDIQRMHEAMSIKDMADMLSGMSLKQLMVGKEKKETTLPCGKFVKHGYYWDKCMKKQGERVLKKMTRTTSARRTDRLAKLYNRIQQQIGSKERLPLIRQDVRVEKPPENQ